MIKNISTKDLANCINKSEGFASQIKNGWRKLPAKYCIIVSERFDIALHELRPDIFPNGAKLQTDKGFVERRVSDL